mmetsp:Transcript_79580/g.257774  ORF Transcript_79580/g.257774 Transcript_79580/m.257774 type:complete len:203 (-) Transcript_79580:1-609(-)
MVSVSSVCSATLACWSHALGFNSCSHTPGIFCSTSPSVYVCLARRCLSRLSLRRCVSLQPLSPTLRRDARRLPSAWSSRSCCASFHCSKRRSSLTRWCTTASRPMFTWTPSVSSLPLPGLLGALVSPPLLLPGAETRGTICLEAMRARSSRSPLTGWQSSAMSSLKPESMGAPGLGDSGRGKPGGVTPPSMAGGHATAARKP